MITRRDFEEALARAERMVAMINAVPRGSGVNAVAEVVQARDVWPEPLREIMVSLVSRGVSVAQASLTCLIVGIEAGRLEGERRTAALASALEVLLEHLKNVRADMQLDDGAHALLEELEGFDSFWAASSALDYLIALDFGHGDREDDERLWDALAILRRELGR